jgi:hypothetical protein
MAGYLLKRRTTMPGGRTTVRYYDFRGEKKTAKEISAILGITTTAVHNRVSRGQELDTEPLRRKPCDGWMFLHGRNRPPEYKRESNKWKRLRKRRIEGVVAESDAPIDRSKPCVIDGMKYKSISEAAKKNGCSYVKARRASLDGTWKTPQYKPVAIDGIQYKSMAEACRVTGISIHKIKTVFMCKRKNKRKSKC